MSRYQCMSMGEYARLLTEDAIHAVDGEVRVFNDEGETEWVKDPDLDPKAEVKASCGELAHHLLQMTASANAIEKLSGFKAENIQEYGAAHESFIQEWADEWAWLYEEE